MFECSECEWNGHHGHAPGCSRAPKPYTQDEIDRIEDDEEAHFQTGRLLATIATLRAEVERLTRERDEALSGRKRPTVGELLRQGGEWLGAARNWLKWHKRNGDSVTWGSSDVLEPAFTAAEVDDLAATVAAAAMAPQPNADALIVAVRARWRAEEERDTARAALGRACDRIDRAANHIENAAELIRSSGIDDDEEAEEEIAFAQSLREEAATLRAGKGG